MENGWWISQRSDTEGFLLSRMHSRMHARMCNTPALMHLGTRPSGLARAKHRPSAFFPLWFVSASTPGTIRASLSRGTKHQLGFRGPQRRRGKHPRRFDDGRLELILRASLASPSRVGGWFVSSQWAHERTQVTSLLSTYYTRQSRFLHGRTRPRAEPWNIMIHSDACPTCQVNAATATRASLSSYHRVPFPPLHHRASPLIFRPPWGAQHNRSQAVDDWGTSTRPARYS